LDSHTARGLRMSLVIGIGIGIMAGAALGTLDRRPVLTNAQIMERARTLGMELLTEMPRLEPPKVAAPAVAPASEPKVRLAVLVRPDSSFTEILQVLKEAGLLSDPQRFTALAQERGADTRVRAGVHVFTQGDSLDQLLENLTRSPTP